jgi:hypothetical protein
MLFASSNVQPIPSPNRLELRLLGAPRHARWLRAPSSDPPVRSQMLRPQRTSCEPSIQTTPSLIEKPSPVEPLDWEELVSEDTILAKGALDVLGDILSGATAGFIVSPCMDPRSSYQLDECGGGRTF